MPSRKRLLIVLLLAVLGPLLATLLYVFPPGENSYYPRCVLHALTGWHCPGCGVTRCLHALLHGDLQQAAAYNLLFLLALPFLVVFAAREGFAWLLGRPGVSLRWPAWVVYGIFALLVTFSIARNLPWPPFSYLAPHFIEEASRVASAPGGD